MRGTVMTAKHKPMLLVLGYWRGLCTPWRKEPVAKNCCCTWAKTGRLWADCTLGRESQIMYSWALLSPEFLKFKSSLGGSKKLKSETGNLILLLFVPSKSSFILRSSTYSGSSFQIKLPFQWKWTSFVSRILTQERCALTTSGIWQDSELQKSFIKRHLCYNKQPLRAALGRISIPQ